MVKTGLKPIDELILLAKEGNGFAFTALWDRHIEQLRSYIKLQIKRVNYMDVDDICSRSFEKAFRQIHNYNQENEKYINGLPEIYREPARKRIIEGMNYKEIAEELNLELNTVKTRIRRAKAQIEKIRKEKENEI